MDAPQISTLGNDTPSPPQQRARVPTLKFRVRPPAPDPVAPVDTAGPSAGGAYEDDEEEDQLIDDEEEPGSNAPSQNGTPFTTSPLKRKPAKAKAPRGKKRSAKEAELHLAGPSDAPPTLTTFALGSADASVNRPVPPLGENWEAPLGQASESISAVPSRGRKRGGGSRRGAGAPRVRKNISK